MSDELDTKLRVLIVDDSDVTARMLEQFLQDDYRVNTVQSGEEALAAARAAPAPDLILLDVLMPGMNGFETCARLKADPNTESVPVIFVTALDDDTNEERVFHVGAVDYINKPLSAAVVRQRVHLHIELKQHREFLERLLEQRTKSLAEAQAEAKRLLEFVKGASQVSS